jgi:hypothetical protein
MLLFVANEELYTIYVLISLVKIKNIDTANLLLSANLVYADLWR